MNQSKTSQVYHKRNRSIFRHAAILTVQTCPAQGEARWAPRVVSCRGCLPASRWCVGVPVVGQHMLLPCSVFSCCCNSNVTLPSGWLTSWSQSREPELTGCRVPATPRSDQIWTVKVTSLSPCCTISSPWYVYIRIINSFTQSDVCLCLIVARLLKYSFYCCQMRYTHPGRNQLRVMLN